MPALLAGAVLLLSCALTLWLMAPQGHTQATRELRRARERWDALAIADYRIVVETTNGPLRCRRAAEVRDGQPTAVDMASCSVGLSPPPDPTVPAMFDAVATMIRAADALDGPAVRTTVEVAYDPRLSYPRTAQLRVEPYPWPFPISLVLTPPLDVELNSYSWQISDVTPLPEP